MSPQATDNLVPREMLALLSNERLIVRETQRAVTPFGGMVVFVEYLRRIDLVGQIRQHMPIRWRSHNQIRSSGDTDFISDGGRGGSQAVRARQLAAWRSGFCMHYSV